jgi:predicted HTH transcriptional regulator
MFEKIQDIQDILDSRTLGLFVGQKENAIFEAKGNIEYDISTPKGRFEIAKDVSSFANSEGGYIIFGLRHSPAANEKTDVITGLELKPENECLVGSYVGIANDNIYPEIDGIKSGWVEDAEQTSSGVGYIFIPPQIEQKKYFLIKRLVEEEQLQKGIIFGITRRVKSDSIPFSVQEMYNTMQNGKSETSQRLYRIESKIDHLSQIPQKKESASERLTDKIKKLFI